MKNPAAITSIVLVLLSGSLWAQERGAITIEGTKRLDKRTPIIVPPFSTTPQTARYARELASVLAYDLEFTGLFKIVPETSYPADFRGLTANAQQLSFDSWRNVDAEYLVHAHLYFQNNPKTGNTELYADFRLFEIFTGEQVVGRRLNVARDGSRRLPHKFADQIVRTLEGVPGCADSRIVFSVGQPGSKEIYAADYDGANIVQLTQFGSISIKPKMSPDSSKIAYMSYKDRYPFIYLYDRGSGKTSPFSTRVGLNSSPAWSPDGRTLALCLSKDGNTEVYVKNADGSGERRLTNDRQNDTSPCYSPDGTKIAFVSDRGGRPQIYVMDSSGRNQRRLSFQGGNSYDPAWSPDGRYIAYVVEKGGEGLEIYMMNSDGQNPRQLSQSPGSNESPTWSPDSRHIVFTSSRGPGARLYTVTIENNVVRPILRLSQMRCEGPFWGPRGN